MSRSQTPSWSQLYIRMIEKQCMSASGGNTSFLLDICGICEMWLVFMTSGYQELHKPSFRIWPLFYWKTPDKGFFRRTSWIVVCIIRSFTLFSVPKKHRAPNRCSINVLGKYEYLRSHPGWQIWLWAFCSYRWQAPRWNQRLWRLKKW